MCAVSEFHPAGRGGETAIDKRPLATAAQVHLNGITGDTRCDTFHHGGTDQALYAYATEEAQRWAGELGREVPPGSFGENLAVSAMPVTDAVVGERWLIGSTVVAEVTMPRVPCNTFKTWMGEPQWVKRFTQRGDTGCYLRVLTTGEVHAGDPIQVLHRPNHGVTVRDLFTAAEQDPQRLQRLLDESEYLAAKAAAMVRRALAAPAGSR